MNTIRQLNTYLSSINDFEITNRFNVSSSTDSTIDSMGSIEDIYNQIELEKKYKRNYNKDYSNNDNKKRKADKEYEAYWKKQLDVNYVKDNTEKKRKLEKEQIKIYYNMNKNNKIDSQIDRNKINNIISNNDNKRSVSSVEIVIACLVASFIVTSLGLQYLSDYAHSLTNDIPS